MTHKWIVYKQRTTNYWIAHPILGLYFDFKTWQEAYSFAKADQIDKWPEYDRERRVRSVA